MPKVFVHGNPETSAIWQTLGAELEDRGVDDVVLLSPPGFGAPSAPGWPATTTAYHEWLVAEIEALGAGPVDIVGHDWGAGHVFGLLAERSDLVRTWAADCVGLVHPDYVWHDMAQLWQTPSVGEETVAAMLDADLADRTAAMAGLGMPPEVAAAVAAEQDDEMGRCILALYRSAAQPALAELGGRLLGAPQRPGLAIVPTEDPYPGPVSSAEDVAASLGATIVTLDGLGHWWMFDAAAPVADALVEHWA